VEYTRRRRSGVLPRTITAIFAVVFVASIISTISAFAAANLFKIQNAELGELSTTAEGSISSFDETNIVSNVTFHKLNDSAKYTITLKNTDSKDHIIQSITDDNENPYVSYIYDNYADTRVNAGDSFDFIVVAKYTNGIADPSARAQATDVKFAIQFADIEEPEIISVSPNTGDAIIKNVIVLAVSAAGLVICAIIYAKNHKKASKLVAVVIFAVIATTITTGVKAAMVVINSFTLTTNYELKDKLSVIYTDKEGNEQGIIANYNEPANIPNQDKDGYTLTRWEDEQGNPVDLTQPITDDLKIHPVYEANSYTVRFESNNGTGSMADVEKDYDETFALPTNSLTREGYEFAGWNTESDGTGVHYENGAEVVNLIADGGGIVTLYAQWTPIRYNIAFHQNADNVSGDMSSMTVAYDESMPLTENVFALEHYKFMGWNTAEDGTGTPYEDKASIKNLTATDGATIDLYAQWKERTATLNTGANVRTALKGLADAPTTFKKYDGENLPDFGALEDKVDIALADSNFPVWAWADGDNIYWWSEAERPNFNRNSSTMFQSMSTLTTIDLDGLESSTAVNMANLFNGCTSLTDLDISEFNTANVENMSGMFHETPALTSINTAALNTVNVKDMSSMFRKTGATSIDISNFDTGNVKTMARMFEYAGASSITLGNPNTLNVTNMSLMFSETAVTSLDVSGLDTDNVENMNGMFEAFYVPSKLTSLNVSNFKTSKVQNFACMFYGQAKLTSLDVSNFDTSSATSMYMMFISMSKAESINVSGWTNDLGPRMDYMFSYTGMGVAGGTVINFENFNTENVTNMDHMFSDMRSETVLDLSGFDTAKVTKMGGMFSSSYASTPMALKTVYVSDKFVTTALTGTQNNIFDNTRAIVGGAGTAWDASSMEKARIDDPDNGKPGYFTYKNARYVNYRDNDGDDTNDESNYALMKSHYVTSADKLTKNAFTRDGFEFTGWNTAADGSGNSYTDEQVMAGLTESKIPLVLYAQWQESTPVELTFYNITEMQQMTADICDTATVPNTNASLFDATGAKVGDKSYIPRRDLIDNRDGKSYQVTKLADGKCWMTQNLALGNSESTMTLTPDDSDVSSDFTLPKSDITAFAGNSDVSAVYVDDTYGGYYSVKTANVDFAEYGKSICPKGWKLPIAYNSGDWSALKRKYNIEEGTSSNNALYDEPFNYTRSFYVSNRRIAVNGWLDTAYIGPATGNGSFSNFGVTISDDYSGTAGITGAEGGSIRCVAR
jgi:uncharacterized protein (TIGR02145 family)/uncharacterized repeat protein (TIGR02543 family)